MSPEREAEMRRRGIFLAGALVMVTSVPALGAQHDPKDDTKDEPKHDVAETCPGHRDDSRKQVVGTDADDVLFVPEGGIGCGLGGDDLLRADRHGNTRLFGGDGDDVFCAENNDADTIYGGDGDDRARSDDSDTVRDVEGDVVLIGCAIRR
jgi:Ca2+-binding RTX toxin-like protein